MPWQHAQAALEGVDRSRVRCPAVRLGRRARPLHRSVVQVGLAQWRVVSAQGCAWAPRRAAWTR